MMTANTNSSRGQLGSLLASAFFVIAGFVTLYDRAV